jgi:two-component system chemotaxis response regulator CheB
VTALVAIMNETDAPSATLSRAECINAAHRVRDVVVIGASAGGFELIMRLASALAPELPASVVVVLHRSATQTGSLLELVQSRCRLPVMEPRGGEPLTPGTLYLAPCDRHVILQHQCIWLSDAPKEHFVRPAANPLFCSAAVEYGPRVLGVVLSGGDSDGASGCRAIWAAGGITLAQDPNEARDPSMPRSTIKYDHVAAVLSMTGIIEAIHELAAGRSIRCPPA